MGRLPEPRQESTVGRYPEALLAFPQWVDYPELSNLEALVGGWGRQGKWSGLRASSRGCPLELRLTYGSPVTWEGVSPILVSARVSKEHRALWGGGILPDPNPLLSLLGGSLESPCSNDRSQREAFPGLLASES